MTIVETTQNIPQGWYPEPTHGVGQRYWDGDQWTEHVFVSGQQYTSPVAGEKTKKKIYWGNLFRVRTWWFSLSTAVIATMIAAGAGASGIANAVFLITFFGIAGFWLTRQMACNECGTILRVTRISGAQKVCHKCGARTD